MEKPTKNKTCIGCLGILAFIIFTCGICSFGGIKTLNSVLINKVEKNGEKMVEEYDMAWLLNFEGNSEDIVDEFKDRGYRFEVMPKDNFADAAWDYDRRVFYIKESDDPDEKYALTKYLMMHEYLHALQGKRSGNYMFDNEYDAYSVSWRYDPKVEEEIPVSKPFFKLFFGNSTSMKELTIITFPLGVTGSSSNIKF